MSFVPRRCAKRRHSLKLWRVFVTKYWCKNLWKQPTILSWWTT